MRVMNPKPIGVYLRRWRVENLGWSLQRAEAESGILNQTIHAIESGASQNPQLKTVKPITEAYGCPWEDVVACYTADLEAHAPAKRKVATA